MLQLMNYHGTLLKLSEEADIVSYPGYIPSSVSSNFGLPLNPLVNLLVIWLACEGKSKLIYVLGIYLLA